ncbi:MAG TPA: SEL1-like repeat protein, partial [Smithella sp.]|nr:SEL1-like repeat protein [Smithella sp.]
ADAQYHLGVIYEEGSGVPQDNEKAIKWYRAAALQGHPEAQNKLEALSPTGNETMPGDTQPPVDGNETIAYTKPDESANVLIVETDELAEQNHDIEQEVPETTAPESNTSPEISDNEKRYRTAAEQGDADIQNRLGLMYKNGDGVMQNNVEAAKWFLKASEQGFADAQLNLGNMYQEGSGVPQNDAEAAKWYREAAEKGHAGAQYNLGLKYFFGEGVPRDFAEAIKWYQKAALQDNVDAQFTLGGIYEEGVVIPEDPAEAERWYRRAAEKGHERARYRLELMHRHV